MGARFDGWIPVRVFLSGAEARVDWCYFGRSRFTHPFFKESAQDALRLPFNQAFRRETPIDALREWSAASPGLPPTVFLHHASRCGSTLVSQMLASLDTHVVCSEPPAIDAVLGARRMSPAITEEMQVEWLRGLVSAMAQPRNGEKALFVKLDSWHIFDHALLRKAFPQARWLYLYRDPVEIAVSQLRERSASMIPGVVGPAMMLFGIEQSMAMSPHEFVVRVLGRKLQAGVDACAGMGVLPVHYLELPQVVWTTFRDLLGIDGSQAATSVLESASRRNAKNPHFEFAADSARKQREATPQTRELALRWAMPAYVELEKARAARPAALQSAPTETARHAAPATP